MKGKPNLWLVAAIAATAFWMPACSTKARGPDANDPEKKTKEAIPIEVTSIERGPIENQIKSSATLEAERTVPVFARTVNQVKEIRVEEGDVVEKGQVLLVMLDDIQRTQFNKAKTQMIKAQKEYNRVKELHDQALVSDEIFQNAELDLEQLKLTLEEAERELGYTIVVAPISGTISKKNVHVGDFVGSRRDESALLFEIVDFNSLVAYLYLPEKHLKELALDQIARVYPTFLNDEPVRGFVSRISPVVDPKTGTVKVTIGFKEIGRLRPGMYVNVELVTYTSPSAIRVPKEALVHDADQIFVFRLIPGLEYPKRKVERVLIAPQRTDRDFIEPADGIKEGDHLVVAGKIGLKDQALVRLPNDPKPSPDKSPAEAKKS